MKTIIGILSLIICLAIGSLLIIYIWDLYPISWILIMKIGITAFIICTIMLLIYLTLSIFFKKDKYDQNKGNKAHPIN